MLRLAERLTEALVVEAGATALRPSSQQLKNTSFSHNSCDYKGATADALSDSCLYNKCKGRREREREERGGETIFKYLHCIYTPSPSIRRFGIQSGQQMYSTHTKFMILRYPMFSESCQFISYMNKPPLSLYLTSTVSSPSKLCAHNQYYI